MELHTQQVSSLLHYATHAEVHQIKTRFLLYLFFTVGPYPQRANEAAHLVLPGAIGFGKSTQIERRGVCAHMSSPKCIIRVNKPLFKNMIFQHARDAC